MEVGKVIGLEDLVRLSLLKRVVLGGKMSRRSSIFAEVCEFLGKRLTLNIEGNKS